MSNSILIWTDAVDCEYTMSEVRTMYMCKFCVFGKPFCLMHDKCGCSLMQRQHMLRKLIFVPHFLVSISFRHVLNHNPNLLKYLLFSVLMPIWLMFRYLSVSQTLGWRLGKKIMVRRNRVSPMRPYKDWLPNQLPWATFAPLVHHDNNLHHSKLMECNLT